MLLIVYFEYFLTKGQIAVLLKEVIQWVGTSGIPADAVHLPGKERGEGETRQHWERVLLYVRGKGEGGREGSPAYLPLLCTVLHFACSVEWGVEEAASWDSYFSWMEHHCKDGILLRGEQRFIEHRATGALGHEDLASGRCAYNP